MHFEQTESIFVRISGNFLDFIRLSVLDENDVFATVFQPTDENQFIKNAWRCLRCGGCDQGEGIALLDLLITIDGVSGWQLVGRIPSRRQQTSRAENQPTSGSPTEVPNEAVKLEEHTSAQLRVRG
jgi:hypothetical protein